MSKHVVKHLVYSTAALTVHHPRPVAGLAATRIKQYLDIPLHHRVAVLSWDKDKLPSSSRKITLDWSSTSDGVQFDVRFAPLVEDGLNTGVSKGSDSCEAVAPSGDKKSVGEKREVSRLEDKPVEATTVEEEKDKKPAGGSATPAEAVKSTFTGDKVKMITFAIQHDGRNRFLHYPLDSPPSFRQVAATARNLFGLDPFVEPYLVSVDDGAEIYELVSEEDWIRYGWPLAVENFELEQGEQRMASMWVFELDTTRAKSSASGSSFTSLFSK